MAQERIIIVEDERLIALELESRLSRLGYTVCAKAVNTEEALEAVRHCDPDLILMDIRINGPGDGIETVKQIQALGHYPVIYITAFADTDTLDRAKETLPYGYLSKPVQERDLRITIEMALHKSKIEKELKKAKQKLEQSETRNRILLNAMPDLIFQITKDGTILDYSTSSIESLYLPPNMFLNKKITEILPESVNKLAMPAIEKCIEDNSIELFEYELPINQEIKNFEARTSRLDENSVLVVIRDITDAKQAELRIIKLNRLYLVRSNINQAIIKINERERLFNEVCRIAVEDGKSVMAWIGMLNLQTNDVEVTASYGKNNSYLDNININLNDEEHSSGPTAIAIKTGKYNYCKDIANDERMRPWRSEALKLGYRSSISLPIKVFGKNQGSISLYSGKVDFYNDEEEIKLLEELTANISFALEFMEKDTLRKQAKDALAESEKRFRSLYENSTMGLYRTTPSGEILLANPTLVKMLGFDSFEELKERDLEDVSYVDYNKRVEFKKLLEENDELTGFESEWYRKDGSVLAVSESTRAVKNTAGDVVYYDGTVEDITLRKQAEEKLKESEEKYRILAESSPEMIYLVDPKGYVSYVNKTAAAQFRAPAQQIIGKHLKEIFPPGLAEQNLEGIQRVIATKESSQREVEMIFPTGKQWIDARLNPVFDEKNKITGVLGLSYDITARKVAEEELQSSKEFIEKIINTIPVRVFWKDKNLIYLGCNQAFAKDAGFDDPKDIIGKDDFEMQWHDQAELYRNDDKQVIENGRDKLFIEEPQKTPEGNIKTVLTSKIPLRDSNGKINGVLGVYMDITDRKQTEEENKKLAEQYELIKSTELFGYWLLDGKGKLIDVNSRYCQMSGYSKEEMLKFSVSDLEVIDKPEDIARRIRRIIKNGSEQFESMHKTKTGRVFDVGINIAYWPSQKSFITLIQDITERKKSELALKESEKKFRAVIESNPSPIFIIKDEKFVFANPGAELITGYNSEELIGKHFLDLIHPDHHKMAIKNSKDRLMGLPAPQRYNIKYVTKNGDTGWLDLAPVVINYDGEPTLLATGIDVTEHKKAEDEIRKLNESLESRVRERTLELQKVNQSLTFEMTEREQAQKEIQKLSQAVEQAPVAVIITDSEGNIEYTNPVFTNVTGYPFKEVKGENPRILKSGHHPESFYQEMWSTIKSGKIWKGDILNKNKDTELSWESTSISPIFSSGGEITHFVAVQTDITLRKKIEGDLKQAISEAEAANRAKSEFLSRMSHELRTPLNSILGFAQLMEMGGLKPAHKNGVRHIMKSGKHLLELINEVLDISKIEAGHITLSLEAIETCTIIKEIQGLISPLLAENKITLEIKHHENLFVRADYQRLKQVLLNLINNAIKYNRENGVITISCEQNEGEGNREATVRINISDTGTGISPEDIPKLFTPFERIGAEKTETEGTGLGLAVVKRLTDIMNGNVGVESELGKGSTFWVELPLAESPYAKAQDSNSKVQKSRSAHKSGTILYIEDNDSNLELVEQILREHRISIRLITNRYGKDAVRLATEYKPDLILLDLDLPDIHGNEVLKLVQADNRTKSIPVVIISADAVDKQIKKLLKAGAKSYLTKPLDVLQFLKEVDIWMNKK